MTIDKAMQILVACGLVMFLIILGGCTGTGPVTAGNNKSFIFNPTINIEAEDGSLVAAAGSSDEAAPLLDKIETKDFMYERDLKPILKAVKDVADIKAGLAVDIAKEKRKALKDQLDARQIEAPVVIEDVSDVLDDPETGASDPSPVDEDEPAQNVMRISHYNTHSWDGRGTSIILCRGDNADEVFIGDRPLSLHGSLDHGREVWTCGRDCPNLLGLGTVRFTNGDVIRFDVNVANTIVRGDC